MFLVIFLNPYLNTPNSYTARETARHTPSVPSAATRGPEVSLDGNP